MVWLHLNCENLLLQLYKL